MALQHRIRSTYNFTTLLLLVAVCLLCLVHPARGDNALLRKRQDVSVSQNEEATSSNNAQQATSSAPINTAPQASNTGSAAASESDALAGLPTSASFGNSIYPGGATFVTPTGSASVSPLYRIDPQENVTFIWEFENLSVQPANLTLAAVGPNSVTYTISAMGGLETSAVWHVSDVPLDYPLMNGYYQIQLYDQRGISAIQSPGWLSPQTTLSIAFYTSGNYENSTATVGNECPTCFYDGAVGLGSAFGIACITSALFIYNLLY